MLTSHHLLMVTLRLNLMQIITATLIINFDYKELLRFFEGHDDVFMSFAIP